MQRMMYSKIWEEVENVVNGVDSNEFYNYDKDLTSFDTDDVLPLNSITHIYSMAIVINSVFKANNKFYPKNYLKIL